MFLLFTTWEEELSRIKFEVAIAEIREIQNIRGLKKKKEREKSQMSKCNHTVEMRSYWDVLQGKVTFHIFCF